MSFEANAWPVVANYFQGLSEDSQVINAYSALSEVPADLTIEYLPEDLPLAILANNHSRKFNLLQGEFQVKEKRSADTVNWLWVAGIACLALVLNFGLKGAELYSLSSQQAVIETEIIEKYKTVFPETKRVRISTVRSQLRQKLAEVGDSDDVAGFLALLVKLEPALASVPEIKPQTLKFDGKRQEVRMQTIAKDYQYFEKLKVAFEKAGLAVNLGAQNNQGDQISGSFSITDTSSKGRS
jgi:general secretion pathway protein L